MRFRHALLAGLLVLLTGCEGYLIDASTQGGEAFIAFVVMVVLFTISLFAMDRIRRRNEP